MAIRARIYALTLAFALTAWSTATLAAADGLQGLEADGGSVQATLLRVGPTRQLSRPSVAARIARDGDTVEIDAGVYDGDVAVWTQHDLTIRGIGGRPHMRANGASAENKGIWVIKGNRTTIENMEFSGATVPNRNGAGIKFEGGDLTLRDCYFHDNENGILGGLDRDSTVLVEHSEFDRNGYGDGYSHNIYVGNVRSFTLRYSYVHRAKVGHNVKSRALGNTILYNRIMDETDGNSSYAIDLPNGGLSYVIGNIIQKGRAAENPTVFYYGAEGLKNAVNELYFVSNTMIDDLAAGGPLISVAAGADRVRIVNNVFSGPGKIVNGPGDLENNVVLEKSDFLDPASFDYQLKSGSAAIGRGIEPGQANGLDLGPQDEYAHPMQKRPRLSSGTGDVGALQFQRQ